jgi:hypothetical protein
MHLWTKAALFLALSGCSVVVAAETRPRVLLAPARLDFLRGAVTQDGWRKTCYGEEYRANALMWLGRDIDIPARSGHLHRFFCTDGTKLELPEDQQFKGDEYACPACGKVYSGEYYDGGRRFMEHRWLVAACRDLAICGALEEDPAFAEKAGEILVKYADAYPGRHTAPAEGGIMYQSLDEAVNFIQLAQAYDLVCAMGLFSKEEQRHIEADLFRESGEGLIKMGIGGNWGSWHLSAVGVMGVAMGYQPFIDYGVESFKKQIRHQLGSDGLWPESVHTYHFYPLRGFIALAEACANTGIDLYGWESEAGKSLRSMFSAPLDYMYPTTQLPAINDGWYGSYLPAGLYEAAYHRYRLPAFAWALRTCYRRPEEERGAASPSSHWTLLLGGALPDDPPRPDFRPVNFNHLGICVLRKGKPENEIFMTFDYGRFLGHGQLDGLGVTLFALGRILAADYGTPGYGSEILGWYRSTPGHNTVAAGGKNQQKLKKGRLESFCDAPGFAAARATTEEAYPGVTWTRTVMVTDHYAVIRDTLESGEAHQYDWYFRSEGERLAIAGIGPMEAAGEAGLPAQVSEIRRGDSEYGFEAAWPQADGAELVMRFGHDGPATVFQARCPAETGARTVPLLAVRRRAESCHFLALLIPRAAGADGPLPEVTQWDEDTITIQRENQTERVYTGETPRLQTLP